MEYIPMITKKGAYELFIAECRVGLPYPALMFSGNKLTALGALVIISVFVSSFTALFRRK